MDKPGIYEEREAWRELVRGLNDLLLGYRAVGTRPAKANRLADSGLKRIERAKKKLDEMGVEVVAQS